MENQSSAEGTNELDAFLSAMGFAKDSPVSRMNPEVYPIYESGRRKVVVVSEDMRHNPFLPNSAQNTTESVVKMECPVKETPAPENVAYTWNERQIQACGSSDDEEESEDDSSLSENRVSFEISNGNDCGFKEKEVAGHSKIVARRDCSNSSDIRKLQNDLEFLLKGNFSDVIVKVKDKEFQCHRCILASRSPIFLAMLSHGTKESTTGVIEIKDAEPNIFSDFLQYVYTGNVKNLNTENMLYLYALSHNYQIIELKNSCLKYMLENISSQNFCDVIAASLLHNEPEVKDACINFFKKDWNSLEIIKSCKWQTFMSKNPKACNELLIKVLESKKDENFAGKL